MILRETIDKVQELNIVDVIGSFVELKRAGSNYKGKSPFSDERTASFMVSPTKHIFKDFSSGKGGGIINFIMEHEHLTYPEAIRFLCGRYNIECVETAKDDAEIALDLQKESMYNMNLHGQQFFKRQLLENEQAMNYMLNDRQLTRETIEKFNIGFAPPTMSAFTNYILNNGLPWKVAVECSLLGFRDEKLYDRFKSRIMFPIPSVSNRLVGFGGRYIGSHKEAAKYLNSTDSIIYNKSDILYGIFHAKKAIAEKNMAYIVEGYVDVVMFHQRGIENTVSPCGTSLTPEQARLIKRFTNRACVIFDSDAPGIKATLRSIDVLLQEGIQVTVCILPAGEDPDSYARKHLKETVLEYIGMNSKDFLIYKLGYLNGLAGDDFGLKSQAITEVCNSIAKIPDAIAREVYMKECARISDMNINSIRELVNHTNKELTDMLPVSEFENQINISKIYIKEQCEKKILQYLLCYGYLILPFKDILINATGEEVIVENLVVYDMIVKYITEDNVEFSNVMYGLIFRNLLSAGHQDINSMRTTFLPDVLHVIDNLIYEEREISQNTFMNPNLKESELIQKKLIDTLAHSIHETLIYNKILYVSDMIDEKLSAEVLDQEGIYDLLVFNANLKKIINLI